MLNIRRMLLQYGRNDVKLKVAIYRLVVLLTQSEMVTTKRLHQEIHLRMLLLFLMQQTLKQGQLIQF